mmetsp:Transcript_84612/g.218045  ORF Transcript_84612/g.218045 Transcript_84612/m.218045 type:complete len:247 (-) Transcript_84612:400-1140(-)
MLAVGLHKLPALRRRVVGLGVIPARQRHVGAVVHAARRDLEELLQHLRAGHLETRAAHSDHLPLMVDVVHRMLPLPWDIQVPSRAFLFGLLELAQPLLHPFVQLTHDGDRVQGVHDGPPVGGACQEEASQRDGPPWAVVCVRHQVGPQQDTGARPSRHLILARLIRRVGLELERACGWPAEDDDHDPVPHELRHPLHDLPLRQGRLVVRSLARLVHDGQRAVRDRYAHALLQGSLQPQAEGRDLLV